MAARGAGAAGRAHAAHRRADERHRHRNDAQSYVAAFVQGLRQLGWIEGRNLRIDVRWNAGDAALARISQRN